MEAIQKLVEVYMERFCGNSKRCLVTLLSILVLVMGIASPSYGRTEEFSEHKARALFVYHFLKFTTWPNSKSKKKKRTICVMGDADIIKGLELVGKNKENTIHFTIQEKNEKSSFDSCDLVFIGRSLTSKLPFLLEIFNSRPIFTVSDIDDFVEKDGMAGLYVSEGQRPQLEFNQKVAKKSKIIINPMLFELARKVIADE